MEAVKHRLIRAFWLSLAVLFLVESWLWDHVKEWLRALGQKLGLSQLEAQLRDFISSLSPPLALAVFAVPALSILPVKILAVEMIAHGHFFWGLIVILAAKTLALGVTAFLFDLCRDKLMQFDWFVRFYDLVLRVRHWAHAHVEPIRQRLHAVRRMILERAASMFGEGKTQFSRRFAHLRALVRRGRTA
jgi:hypothetical protein